MVVSIIRKESLGALLFVYSHRDFYDCLFDLPHRLSQPRVCLLYSVPDGGLNDVIQESDTEAPEAEEEEGIGKHECIVHGIILS